MIKTSDGYFIEQFVDQNKIVIVLPQTLETLTDTMSLVSSRKKELSDDELLDILMIVRNYAKHRRKYL